MLRAGLIYLYCLVFVFCFAYAVNGQRIAVLAPDDTASSKHFAEKLAAELSNVLMVLDTSLSRAAYMSSPPASPFNMTAQQAATLGKVIGCDLFILLRSATQRRSAFGRAEYYEAFAAIYLVSTRTGRLVQWKLHRAESAKAKEAELMLDGMVGPVASEISDAVRIAMKTEIIEPEIDMEEPPSENSLAAKGFRAPIPFRRIKPEYTAEAALYDITATVEILVDLDAAGTILRTRIIRWAGYGLNESVESTVRQMNWRAAERNGKPLPMRFLLRYNFKKIETD